MTQLKADWGLIILTSFKLSGSDDKGLVGQQSHHPYVHVNQALHDFVVINQAELHAKPKCSTQVQRKDVGEEEWTEGEGKNDFPSN